MASADVDGDGDLDLYVGYSGHQGPANRLYRNELHGSEPVVGGVQFTQIGQQAGVAVQGLTRQVAFVDYDADGDVDLYVALRDDANLLLQNNSGVFTDVSELRAVLDEPEDAITGRLRELAGEGLVIERAEGIYVWDSEGNRVGLHALA